MIDAPMETRLMVGVAGGPMTHPMYDPGEGGGAEPPRAPPPPSPPDPAVPPVPAAPAAPEAITPVVSSPVAPASPNLETATDAREMWREDASTTYRVQAIQDSVAIDAGTSDPDGSASPGGSWVPDWLQGGIDQLGTTSRQVVGTLGDTFTDATGNLVDGVTGFVDGLASPVDHGPIYGNEMTYAGGKVLGATVGLVADAAVVSEGVTLASGGVVVSGTGVGAVAGVPAVASGAVLATAGVAGATFHSQRFVDGTNQLLQASASEPPRVLPTGEPASGRRLVIGGGRDPSFPEIGPGNVGVNISPGARPHVVGDGNRLPIRDGSFSEVVVENLRPNDFAGRGMLSESHRVLEPSGTIKVMTGGGAGSASRQAEIAEITVELQNAGFRGVNVAREYGPSGHPADFRYVITATKP